MVQIDKILIIMLSGEWKTYKYKLKYEHDGDFLFV